MTDCAAVQDQLWEYLDAELPMAILVDFTRHMGDCGPCRTAAAFDRALLDLLGRQRAVIPPARAVWKVKIALRSAQAI